MTHGEDMYIGTLVILSDEALEQFKREIEEEGELFKVFSPHNKPVKVKYVEKRKDNTPLIYLDAPDDTRAALDAYWLVKYFPGINGIIEDLDRLENKYK